jgi:hypothetical protein
MLPSLDGSVSPFQVIHFSWDKLRIAKDAIGGYRDGAFDWPGHPSAV